MIYIILFSIISVLFMSLLFTAFRISFTKNELFTATKEEESLFKKSFTWIFLFMTAIALFVRLLCAIYFDGHPDIECFKYWGDLVYNNGFRSFYTSETFADYMPGYIYILRLVSAIRHLIGTNYDTSLATVLFKMPAIIFDFANAALFYKIGKDRFGKKPAFIFMSLFLFNPIVILNSAVWGQIDSILTFCIVLMVYLVYVDKLKFAYIVYGLGVLVKPQMLVYTPILLFAFVEEFTVTKNKNNKYVFSFSAEKLLLQAKYALVSIIACIVLCLPFGIKNVILQCFETMSSYEYASVNAYNFWAMLGLDWASQDDYLLFLTYKQWGMLVIFVLIVIASIIWLKNFKERSRYVIIGAMLGIGMFTFSVRMHERYIFPSIILLLLVFMLTKKKDTFWFYVFFSALNFINSAHVLFYYDPYNFDGRIAAIEFTGLLCTVLTVMFFIYVFKKYIISSCKFKSNDEILIKNDDSESDFHVASSDKDSPMTLKEYVIIALITILYAVVAYYNLGDKNVPQSPYNFSEDNDELILELPDESYIESIEYYLGNYENREFIVYLSNDKEQWSCVGDITMESVFCWDKITVNNNARYIRFNLINDKAVINELVIRTEDNKTIVPVNLANDEEALFDEQDCVVDEFTYRNSTIFDEIYHARSAYEFNNNLYCYEWTHPPLGKWFISLGMKMFGTTPFGWRFMGTLFGVLMLPFMYLIGRKLFKSQFFATVTCLLMAFEFMHFSQSRIATIDVFVTFFIILMYYFMLCYYQKSFYDTPLYKTFIPLGLCGISMGLGCASKWTGVYAGAGLGVIFFYTMYVRYKEYKYAKSNPNGKSGNIDNKYIIDVFWKNLLKTGLFCVVFFIIIPIIIYTLSYIPFVPCDESPTSLIGRAIYNQKAMFNYHKDCIFDHPYSSRWYEWLTMYKPILYYSGVTENGMLERISSFGNPLIWWSGIAAFVYMLIRVKRYKDKTALFLCIGYLAQLLPWTLVIRTTFIYHYFTSVPFVIMMDAYCLNIMVKKNSGNKKAAILYVAVAGILFALFYPCLSGYPMPEFFDYNILRWLNSWYL